MSSVLSPAPSSASKRWGTPEKQDPANPKVILKRLKKIDLSSLISNLTHQKYLRQYSIYFHILSPLQRYGTVQHLSQEKDLQKAFRILCKRLRKEECVIAIVYDQSRQKITPFKPSRHSYKDICGFIDLQEAQNSFFREHGKMNIWFSRLVYARFIWDYINAQTHRIIERQ